MDDTAFLARVADLLPQQLLPEDIAITAVRPAGGRPWPRTEVTFRMVDPPHSWPGPTEGAAYLPLALEWRYASGCEDPEGYALLLASEIGSAALRSFNPSPAAPPPTPSQVEERWQWLLERLALSGDVRELGDGRLIVGRETREGFTVLVTPDEWAPIAEPLDPDADDPQDFGYHSDDEVYLVFYEGNLVWSIRPELPPVRGGGDLRRKYLTAQAQGRTDVGWFAYPPTSTKRSAG